MKRFITIIVHLVFFLCPSQAYNLRQLSSKNGLSNSAVLSLGQDKDGFMWFGTCDGLNIYDGQTIKIYKPSNSEYHLSGNLIRNIICDSSDVFWIDTNYGFNRLNYNKGKIDYFNITKDSYFLRPINQSVYFLQAENEFYYYHNPTKSFIKLTLDEIKFQDILETLVIDNNLWVFTKNNKSKCFHLNLSNNQQYTVKSVSFLNHPSKLLFCFKEEKSVYFIDDSFALFEYNIIENSIIYISNLKEQIKTRGDVSSIIKFKNDFYIGFKTNGIIRLYHDVNLNYKFNIEQIDIGCGVFCMKKDRFQDLIWIGTDGRGVYMYSNELYSVKASVFENYTNRIKKPVRAIYLDAENNLWIGTKGDGILKMHDFNSNQTMTSSGLEYINSENSNLTDNSVYAFCKGSNNTLWIGTENGLNYYSFVNKQLKKGNLIIGNEIVKYIHSISAIGDSMLWIATVGAGIVKTKIHWVNNEPHFYNSERLVVNNGKFSYNNFFVSYVENANSIWFGSRGFGAYNILSPQNELIRLTFDKFKNNQTLNDIFSIFKDKSGNMWYGTSAGLIRYSPEKVITVFDENCGLTNNTVHGIIQDSQNNLWLSTNQGIVRFNTDRGIFQLYNNLNGLDVIEYSDGAFFKSDDGKQLFFGGINGFTVVAETNNKPKSFLPPIKFTSLSIFGHEYNIEQFIFRKNEHDILNLSYQQNFFTISYSAIDYINGSNYIYKYRLDGMSDKWIDNGSQKKIVFTNVSPGEYILNVKFINKSTGQQSQIFPIVIKINPPYYKSKFAYLFYILFALGITFLIYKEISARVKRQKREFLEKIRIKQQEELFESKLQFFTNIAHEFCTPLTLIYGPCNRILSHNKSDSFVRDYTNIIQRNAERLMDLIHEIIEFRRIETGNRPVIIKSLDIPELVYEIVESFKDLAKSKNIELLTDIPIGLMWNSDESFLFTIISNLISSALACSFDQKTIGIDVLELENNLCIKVSNVSFGSGKKELGQMFDKQSILNDFENRKDNSYNRIGLAIANSLVELLDGSIDIINVADINAAVVKLPHKDINSIIKNVNSEFPENRIRDYEPLVKLPIYPIDKSKQTILIIDEDLEVLWFICEVFVTEYNVVPINKPVHSTDILNEFHPDIIICDVTFSAIDGVAFTKELKANKEIAHIPIILISAKQTIEEQIQGLAAGAEKYITKPFNIDFLKASVKQLISSSNTLKEYFNSPLSAYELIEGKLKHKDDQKIIKKIYSIIDKHISNQDLSPSLIASELGIGIRQLYRKINDIGLNDKLTDIIKDCRLKIACDLLIKTKMSVDEIVYQSGFSNRATFYKSFVEKVKLSPTEYRDKTLNNIFPDKKYNR